MKDMRMTAPRRACKHTRTIFISLRIPFKEGDQKAQQTPNSTIVTSEKVFVDWSV